MRRRALLAFGAVVGVGLIALVAVAGLEHKSGAFTLGVAPAAGVARVAPQQELCQRPIDVVAPFEKVWLQLGTYGRPGQPFALTVSDASSDRTIARARVATRYGDNEALTVPLPRTVPEGERVAVCVRNAGDRAIAPYGNSGLSNQPSAAYRDGDKQGGDVAFVFIRDEPSTVLGLVPSIVERASLFHGGWSSTAAYWVLLGLLLVAPASLAALAVRAAVRDST
jgi:hypothetical protein